MESLRFARALAVTALVGSSSFASFACQTSGGDPASSMDASAIGPYSRISDVTNPTSPGHSASTPVHISGATYLWLDTYDETQNGKSRGTVFLQDVGASKPYSGVSLFSPTYNPASLKPAPGDVLDLTGTYQENAAIGSAKFPAPQVLPQVSKPIVTPRFEYSVPEGVVIDPTDLNDYDKGRQWLSMLVTINDVTFLDNMVDDGNGRDTAHPTSNAAGVTISNELFDVASWNKTSGAIGATKHVKSITGIVTWFFSYHIAPRSPDDIVVQ